MERRKLLEPLNKKKILFIAAQAGQASYLNPLWDKWRESLPENIDFKIWASADAIKLMDERLAGYTHPWDQNNILDEFKPDLIVSSACGEEQELFASKYARQNSCKHIQFIDTFYGYKSRIEASNFEGYQPHEIWFIHDVAMNEAISEGVESERVKVVGHPYFEKLAKTPIENKAASGSVVFVAQPISQISGLKDELGYDENDIWELLRDFRAKNSDVIKTLIYAPHPAQRNTPELKGDEQLLKSSESAFEAAEIMVGMFSTIMIEAYLKGQSVISIQCGLKTKNKDILSRAGFIPLINEQKDFQVFRQKRERGDNSDFLKSFDQSLIKIESAVMNI